MSGTDTGAVATTNPERSPLKRMLMPSRPASIVLLTIGCSNQFLILVGYRYYLQWTQDPKPLRDPYTTPIPTTPKQNQNTALATLLSPRQSLTQFHMLSILSIMTLIKNKYSIDTLISQFKTRQCKGCLEQNFMCAYYHSDMDRRRDPATNCYSPIYLENNVDTAHCLNFAEYLYHPNNYKTQKCPYGDCSKYFLHCPYQHSNKDARTAPQKQGMYNETQQQLDDILANLNKNPTTPKIKPSKIELGETPLSITHELSAIDFNKGESLEEQLHNFQSPPHYILGQKAPFREDRKHQFKAYNKLNLKYHVPIIFEIMCAFLNCQGGTLFIGIADDGVVCGIELTDKEIDRLMLDIDQGCKADFRPPLMPQKYKVTLVPVFQQTMYQKNLYVIEVSVQKESKDGQLFLYNRQCYMRMNASVHRLLASEIIENERLQNEKKNEKAMSKLVAILTNNSKYFEKQSQSELRSLKKRLELSLATVSQILSGRGAE